MNNDKKRAHNFKDLSGLKFGRLEVVNINHKADPGRSARLYWNCICDCGNKKIARGDRMKSGAVRSCGCLTVESCKATTNKHRTHGLAKTPIYKVWIAMKARCLNLKLPVYARYRGRGIKVCNRWLKFENFLEDMGERPQGTSIDRIDNDGNYEPGNCKWSTQKEQVRNRGTTVFLLHNGIRKTLTEYAEERNIPASTLRRRLDYGWSVEKALTTPVRTLRRKNK